MSKAICLLSVIPMRKEPSHRSEMVSQVLFGEFVTISEEKDDFMRVTCLYDGYEGWVQANQLKPVDDAEVRQTTAYTNSFASLIAVNQTSVHAPHGSPVYQPETRSVTIAGDEINYLLAPQQIWHSQNMPFNETVLASAYQPYLNAPYLWGGRSVFGIDCSGFAQQVFKLFGIKLLRDAYLQAEQGMKVESIQEAKIGDLAFFQNEKGKVTHVGILLSSNKIVHASGRVRVDTVTGKGITNEETGKQTHQIHSIRRVIS